MNPDTLKPIALVLFVLMYIGIIALPRFKMYIALGTAAIYVLLGILPIGQIIPSVNWNALMMIAGTMIIVHYFIASQMPNRIADVLLNKAPNVMWVTILMSLFAGFV